MWSWTELVSELGRVGLRRRVVEGSLLKVGHGWYASPTATEHAVAAVRLGGHLGCLSGCQLHGLWVPPDPYLHVTFNRGTPSTLASDVVGHHARDIGREPALRPLLTCLTEVVRHHDTETALIVLDSALNRQLLTETDVVSLAADCPKKTRRVLRYLDGRADSGTETRVRYFFQRRRVPVEPQVYVPGVGRVDLLVGRSLMIECDSWEHHTGEENYNRDRDRDLVINQDRSRVLRLSYRQVFHDWPRTSRALSRLVNLRLHRSRPLSAR